MNLSIRAVTAAFTLTLLCGLLWPAGNVQAARLVLQDSQAVEFRDGQVFENPAGYSSRANPNEIWFTTDFSRLIVVLEGEEPDAGTSIGTQIANYLIEPEDDEAVGDPVCYSYEITLSVETLVDGNSAAMAGAGGADDIEALADTEPAEASVSMSGGILHVTDLGVVATFGPIDASGNGDDLLELSGHFRTLIGEEISFDTGVALAVAVDAPGEGSAVALHDLQIIEQDLSACPAGPFDLNLEVTGSGNVTTDPDQAEYFEGDQVTLTAIPDTGWEFVRWEGQFEEVMSERGVASSTSNPMTVLVGEQDLTVNAIFEPSGVPAPTPLAVPVNHPVWLLLLGLMLVLIAARTLGRVRS